MYRTPVSGVFRPQSFWFRGLWQKPGQRFPLCGGNPASQDLRSGAFLRVEFLEAAFRA
jgi:hypothetical protein